MNVPKTMVSRFACVAEKKSFPSVSRAQIKAKRLENGLESALSLFLAGPHPVLTKTPWTTAVSSIDMQRLPATSSRINTLLHYCRWTRVSTQLVRGAILWTFLKRILSFFFIILPIVVIESLS